MGEARRAREEKKCWQGRGSSLRKLFRQRGLGSIISPSVADAICVSSWTRLFWLSMAGHEDVGRKMSSLSRVALPLCGSSAYIHCIADVSKA